MAGPRASIPEPRWFKSLQSMHDRCCFYPGALGVARLASEGGLPSSFALTHPVACFRGESRRMSNRL